MKSRVEKKRRKKEKQKRILKAPGHKKRENEARREGERHKWIDHQDQKDAKQNVHSINMQDRKVIANPLFGSHLTPHYCYYSCYYCHYYCHYCKQDLHKATKHAQHQTIESIDYIKSHSYSQEAQGLRADEVSSYCVPFSREEELQRLAKTNLPLQCAYAHEIALVRAQKLRIMQFRPALRWVAVCRQ